MWKGLGSMNKGPNATICLVRRQNHAGTTDSWTTVQREKSSHAYKLSSNVQTACSTDSLNNCPKHSILIFEFWAENLLIIENVSSQLTVFHCLCPLPASRKGLRLPLRSALFGEGGRDWRPCISMRQKLTLAGKYLRRHHN